MAVINRVAEFTPEIAGWRQHLHRNPELLFDLAGTSAFVAEKLREFGCDIVETGIGQSGVVAVIRGRSGDSRRRIGLRADMDALPIEEIGEAGYRSQVPGKMHACGHDGHTAMLLGAARYLAETRNFDGEAVMVFQPAEEGANGARAMLDDGLMERFGIQEIYGMHNLPGMEVGRFAVRAGPVMAAADTFRITLNGKGAHAAMPHMGRDPIVAACHLVTALQSIVSRDVDSLERAVVSVGRISAGDAFNVIPHSAEILGTVRTFSAQVQDLVEKRLGEIACQIGAAFGSQAETAYSREVPAMINRPEQAAFLERVASGIVGQDNIVTDMPAMMGAEDFAEMLNARPGAYLFLGNGDSAALHHPAYDFSDDAIPYGVSLWARLVETAMPAGGGRP